ncbi:effector locus protein, partial [Pseudomonas syringae pv. japonica str. M301072]
REGAPAEGVLLLMKSFADLAREWREHGFMGPVGTASASVSTPASKATMRDTPASSGRFQ